MKDLKVQKEVPYRIPFGDETYEVKVDTTKFYAGFLRHYIVGYCDKTGASIAELRTALAKYLSNDDIIDHNLRYEPA